MFDYRQIGKTSLSVPRFGLGTAHLGGQVTRLSDEDSQATLNAAWNGGVRFYDSAPFYGRGLSEHRAGGFLLNKPRAEFVMTTKVGRVLHRPHDIASFRRSSWPGGLNFEIEFDYSYDGFMRSYEQSLMRLGLDTVDALLVHDLDANGHGGSFEWHVRNLRTSGMKALEQLKRSGDIKAIGMGINSAVSLEQVAPQVELDFVLVAMPYTLADQSALHTGFAWCQRHGMSVVIGAPLASGILATGPGPNARYAYAPAPEEIQTKVGAIQQVCRRHGVPLPAAALQFPLAHPVVAAIIPGAARATEVEQNLASMQVNIPADFWAELKAEGLIDAEAPTPA